MTRVVCVRVVCLCVLVAALAACWGCSAKKESLVAKGNQLFASAKYEEAALNYRAALQKDPGYGEGYYRLGLTAIKLDQAHAAYETLFRAVQLEPLNVDAKVKFTDVCLNLYLADPSHAQVLYNQINKLSDELLAQDPNSHQGLMLKGYLASTDQKPKEAIEYLRKALHVNSSNDGVVTELAHLLIRNGEAQEGEQLLTDLIVRKKTTYGPAYELLYSLYQQTNRPADAENILRAKVNNNPKNADYVLELAAYYNHARNTRGMTDSLGRLLDDPKDFPQARLWVGDFYLRLRDYSEAISFYQQGMRASRDAKTKVAYEMRNVLALVSQGKRNDALQLAGEFQRENPKDSGILRMHADLLLAEGRSENADLAVREFQELSSQNPSDTALRMQLGRAYRLKGDLDSARSQFLEALHQRQDLSAARFQLADIAMIQHRPQEAVQQASEILRTQPNDRQVRLLYASALTAAGDAATARTVLTRLIQEFPQDREPQVQMGLVALAGRNFPQAIQILSKYRANADARTASSLASAYMHEKQFDQARTILKEGLAKWPGSSTLSEERADVEALSNNYDLALQLYQEALAQDPKSVDIRLRLAEIYGLQGDRSRALTYYQEAHKLAPDDVAAASSLADALSAAGRIEEARTIYKSVAKAHPENAPVLNNAAFFLADTGGDLDEALRLAQNALARIPGQPSFSDTVGYIYLKKGMLDSAIQSFSTLARRYPASASFRYHLGLALFQKGEKAGARKELEAALADHPSREETLRIRELLNEIS